MFIFEFINPLIDGVVTLFDLFFMPFSELVPLIPSNFLKFVYQLISLGENVEFITNASLASLTFGVGLVIMLVVNVVKWVIPFD